MTAEYSTKTRADDWYYVKKGPVRDTEVGPFADCQMIGLVDKRKIKDGTVVRSSTITADRWVPAGQVDWEPIRERLSKPIEKVRRELEERQVIAGQKRTELEQLAAALEKEKHQLEKLHDLSREEQAIRRAQVVAKEKALAQEWQQLRRTEEVIQMEQQLLSKRESEIESQRQQKAEEQEARKRQEVMRAAQQAEKERKQREREAEELEKKRSRQADAAGQQREKARAGQPNEHLSLENYAGCCVAIAVLGFILVAVMVLLFLIALNGRGGAEVGATFGAVIGSLITGSFLWLVFAALLKGFRHLLVKTDETTRVLDAIFRELKKRDE